MGNKYIINYENRCVEFFKPTGSIIVYKLPYEEVKKTILPINIPNRFIVYILVGVNDKKQEVIYVGKSKNGMDNRPTAHETDGIRWFYCYILTTFSEKTFFNDAAIQYVENRIYSDIKKSSRFVSLTKATNSNTISDFEREICEEYLEEAYNMLYIGGLDLLPEIQNIEKEENDIQVSDVCMVIQNLLTE